MKNKDTQYYIYLRATKEKVPVTEQEFKDYYRDIDSYRKRQQRHGKCVCPMAKRLYCDMDCQTCPFYRAGDSLSLNYITADDDGNERSWIDDLEDISTPFEEIITDGIAMTEILARIQELMPEAIEIGKYRLEGMCDTHIAQVIGIKNTTFRSRLEKLKKALSAEFPDIF